MPSTTHTLSQATLSESNRSHILHYLYHNGISSRAQIARALNLTPAAITKITAKLIDDGIITETRMRSESSTPTHEGAKRTLAHSNRSGRSVGLRLCSDSFHVIGVKFARSLLQIGTFDLDGNQLSLKDLPTVTESTIDASLDALHQDIVSLIDQDPYVAAIGMAVPGPYLHAEGRTAVVSSMNSWRKVNFRKEFETSFSVPVFIEQDARAGALAESLFEMHADTHSPNPRQPLATASVETDERRPSADHKSDEGNEPDDRDARANLAYYLLGEGVGLGVIEDGRLVDGHLGTAAELGHVSIDVNGKPCECGNRGCLEQYCSAVATHHIMQEQNYPGIEGLSHRQACERLFADAKDSERPMHFHAKNIIDQVARYIGYGCVTIINAYNPRRIILGDILSHAGPRMLDTVRTVARERVIPEIYESTSIELSALPTDATVSGAAAVAITAFLDNPSRFLPGKRLPNST